MGRRKKFRRLIFILVVLMILGFAVGVFLHNKCNFTSELAEMGEIKNSIETTGFVVRDEELLTVKAPYGKDNLKYLCSDGDKIACHSVYAEVYSTPEEASDGYMVDNINSELDILEGLNNIRGNISKSLSSVNKQINDEIDNLFVSINNSELSKIQNTKKKLRYLLSERQIILGKDVNFENKIVELKGERGSILGKNRPAVDYLKMPHSGEFVGHADGYENLVDYKNVLNMDLDKFNFNDFFPESVRENTVGKIIKSGTWYVVCDVDSDAASYISVGMDLNLSIPSIGGEKHFPATVETMKKLSDGNMTKIVLSCNYMSKEIAYLRYENFKIMFDNFRGIMIKKDSLHKADTGVGETGFGVYIKIGNYLKWKSVIPLFFNKDEVVCKYGAEEYMNENYLQPGDNVVVGGKDLYVGKNLN